MDYPHGGFFDAGMVPDFFQAAHAPFTAANYVPEDIPVHPKRHRRNTWTHAATLDHFWPTITQNYLRTYTPDDFYFPSNHRLPLYRHDGGEHGLYQYFGSDTVRIYFTGAGSDAGTQTNQASCFGGYRSSTEAFAHGALFSRAIHGLTVEAASRQTGGGGQGIIQANAMGQVGYRGPDGTLGTKRYVANGETAVLEDGDDPSLFVRVTCNTTGTLTGTTLLDFHDQYTNVYGMTDVTNAQSVAGMDRYRGIMLHSSADVSSMKFWIGTLGDSAVSSVTQLGGAGSGTIAGPSDCVIGWPLKGWAHIKTSGGTTREIIYYRSRTDSTLTVPLTGRGRLGTSAMAGASTDVIWPVPGIRIAKEEPSPAKNAAIQVIANETTSPTGRTWSTEITSAAGVAFDTLHENGNAGLWIHSEIPASASGFSKHQNEIRYSFQHGTNTFTGTLAGLYRVAQTSLERYELHIGVDAEPDITATPDETFSSLPYTTLTTFAPDHDYYFVTNYRNRYDLATQSQSSTILSIDSGGNEGIEPPSPPRYIVWKATGSGKFALKAVYMNAADGDDPATHWAIYLRTNGTDPDPAIDTPTLVAITYEGNGAAGLDYLTIAYTAGTVGKVLLRTKRTSDSKFSTNTDIFTATAATAGPQAPRGAAFYQGVAEPYGASSAPISENPDEVLGP